MKLSVVDLISAYRAKKEFQMNITLNPNKFDHDFVSEINFNVSGEVIKDANKFNLVLNYTSDIPYLCDRCMEKSILKVDESTEYDLNETDIELFDSLISNGMLDIDKALFDDFYTMLPTILLCKDDCNGVCSRCGKNLNFEECVCEDDYIDPRFQQLKDFLDSNKGV